MINRLRLLALVVILALTQTGCATTSSVANASGKSAVPFDLPEPCLVVREVLEPALIELKFKIESIEDSNSCNRTVVATKTVSAFSWGEIVRVSLRETDSRSSKLEITTERRLATNITAKGDWSAEIHDAVLGKLAEADQDNVPE